MKDKNDGDLGSWKRAVTTADGTWQILCMGYCSILYISTLAASVFTPSTNGLFLSGFTYIDS